MLSRLRRRPLLVASSGGALVVAGILGLAPRPLDDELPAGLKREAARVVTDAAVALAAHADPLPLRAGWAAVHLAVPDGIPLAGYGARRGAASTGIHDPLFVRALCLETDAHRVLVICQDILLANPALAAEIERRLARDLGSSPTTVLFTATHTHSGPGGWGEMFLEESVTGSFDRRFFLDLAESTAEAARQAIGGLSPSSVGRLTLAAPDLLRNRTVQGGAVDPALEILVLDPIAGPDHDQGVDGHDGRKAVLVVFGAHATCLSADNLLLSGDYPGAMVNALESAEGIDFAAFAAGVVGSHSPAPPVPGGFDAAASLGNTLADRVLSALPETRWATSVAFSGTTCHLPMPEMQLRVSDDRRLPAWVGGLLHPAQGRLSAFRMDDLLWIGLPVEMSGMLSPALRRHAAASGLDLTLTCFNGDYLGYVVPDEVYEDADRYESRVNFLGPRGGSFVTGLLAQLIGEVAERRPVPPASGTSGAD